MRIETLTPRSDACDFGTKRAALSLWKLVSEGRSSSSCHSPSRITSRPRGPRSSFYLSEVSGIIFGFGTRASTIMARALFSLVLCVLLFSAAAADVSASASVIVSTDALSKAVKYVSDSANNVRTWTQRSNDFGTSFIGVNVETSSSSGNSNAKVDTMTLESNGNGLLGFLKTFPFVNWGYSTSQLSVGNNGINANATAVYNSFSALAYITYVDNNGNNVYDQGEETSVVPLNTIGLSTSITPSTSASGVSIAASASADNEFGMRYTVSGKPLSNQGSNVKEDTVKIDVWLTPKYPNNADANTKVALIALFSVKQASASLSGNIANGNITISGAGKIQATGDTNAGAGLTWANHADVLNSDNSKGSTSVTSNILNIQTSGTFRFAGVSLGWNAKTQGGLGRLLVFNFDAKKPQQIYWDPQLGANPSSATALAASCLMIAVLALLF
ncbi:hypothetical protein PROFUN_04400 [Planoprotostelium fungivorum]|uniref:Uncharacterized protein n=1 Tax=Planoprotostelium fungivorum TaxID=1890364 RepID=A0A2P6NHT3_9EUKA|nr:hypothetical protein PROFUN_04400 [Planoprotostelium fungivorum]